MKRSLRTLLSSALLALVLVITGQHAAAQESSSPSSSSSSSNNAAAKPAENLQKLYDRVTPSLVAVQFTWEYEYGKADFVEAGVVVSADGLILVPGAELVPRLPAEQIKDFKVIVPRIEKDNEELDAEFVGHDARSDVFFVRVKEKRDWKPITFEDVPMKVGEPITSVGLLSRDAGYRSYLSTSTVGAHSRGEIPTIVATGGGLANVGAPVFNASGQAIGWVNYYTGTQFLLHTTFTRRGAPEAIAPLDALMNPPVLFVPSNIIIPSLKSPPTMGKPQQLPWIGLPNLSGMNKDVAAAYGLENQPAIEIGDVVPGSPADKAGLKVGMKIVKMNGQPLERGDMPDELPAILTRNIIRMPIGAEVTFSILTEKDKPLQDFKLTLTERPINNTYAKRFWADDLGFGVRELVFDDTYERKQPADMKGVLVTIIKAQSAAASAKLAREDVVTQFNNQPVTDVEQFKKDYEALRKEKPKEAIVLVVMKRDASTQTIRIEPPQ